MSVAALNLLATAKPELLWERKQEAAAVRENKQNITNTLLPAPLLLMSKASICVPHSGLASPLG